TAGRPIDGLPAHVVAAIDVQVGAGDPGGLFGDQESHRVGDLLRPSQAAGRDVGHDLGADVLRHGHDHVGGHVTGGYGVDRDAQAGVLACQGDGEPVHAGLGRSVVGLAVLALEAIDRADLDDPAPLALAHALDHRTGDVEHRVEVGVDHLVPLLGGHAVEGGVAGDAGVVDQDLDRAQRRLDPAHQRGAPLGGADVARHQGDLVAVLAHPHLPGAALSRAASTQRTSAAPPSGVPTSPGTRVTS